MINPYNVTNRSADSNILIIILLHLKILFLQLNLQEIIHHSLEFQK